MPRRKPRGPLQKRQPARPRVVHDEESEQEGQIVVSSEYTGPLPLPDHFRQYNDVVPGAGDRILKMAETEGTQRRLRALIETLVYSAAVGAALWFGISRLGSDDPLTAAVVIAGALIAAAVHRRQ